VFRSRRSRRSAASVAGLSAISTVIVGLALTDPGYLSPDVQLNDSGVWVTRQAGPEQVGRFNYQAQTIDAGLVGGSQSVDVLQNGDLVLLTDPGAGTVSVVDPAAVEATGAVTLPEGARVALGGTTVAIWGAAAKSVWVVPASDLSSFDPKELDPAVAIAAGAAVAVGQDGTTYVADPQSQSLTTVPAPKDGAPGAPRTAALDVATDADVALTVVGDTPVVLDRSTSRALVDGHALDVPAAEAAVVQEPGPAASTVALAGPDGLLLLPLDGSAPEQVPASGSPAPPVRVGDCTYGAWSTGDVVRQCGQDRITPNVGVTGDLRYRVNRGYVVLNDLADGTVWLADQQYELRNTWNDLLPAQDPNAQQSEDVATDAEKILRERDLPNRPPTAHDDTFGVRPGRTTILTVLDNDTDPDGDILRATPDTQPAFGQVQAILNGAALQVTVPQDATGTSTFTYTLDDGRENGTDTGTVTLQVRGPGDNNPPKRIRETTATVEQGSTVDVKALDDWRDPDGDVLTLVGASATTKGDSVRFTADGRLTFIDSGTEVTRKTVDIQVSDGQATVDGQLTIDVTPRGENQPPFAAVDHVSAVAGREITISPLDNDTDPNGDVLRLARVDDVAGVTLGRNLQAGTVTFTAATAGVYYVNYLVTDGPGVSVGLIRVDVSPADAEAQPPVAVRDRALLPSDGSVLVDVLANDSDPAGSVLVVQSVDVDPSSGVSVAVLDHSVLRITAIKVGAAPFTLHYTVSNGSASSQGEVVVLPITSEGESQSPRAVEDEVTVRAGDVVTIDVLANDTHPDGLPMSVDPTLVDPPPASAGLMFVSENTVRFQAAPTAGGQTVHATYTVRDQQDHTDSAQITVHIKAADAADNSVPNPSTVTARVVAGETTRIAIPLTGIDPDGDSVELLGLGRAPARGRVTAVGDGWIEYEAARGASGTDSFTYQVADRFGATAEGTVLVGIAPPLFANQPPVAVDDHRVVRPNREVSVPVLANDVDPEGDTLGLYGKPEASDGIEATYDKDQVVVKTGATPGTYAVRYGVYDGTSSAEGVLTVEVRPDAPTLPPIARDDRLALSDVVGRDAVEVAVLENDEDPDGSRSTLTVSTKVPDVTVSPSGTLTIPVLPDPRVVAYTVTDPDQNTATAFVRVPGSAGARPALRSDLKPLEVVSGQELRIDLRDDVVVAAGRTVRITQAEKVSALRGTPSVVDEHTLAFVSENLYYGPAAITFEVIDTPTVDDPIGRTATLSIPITVKPSADEPPELTGMDLEAPLGTTTPLDLSRYAFDPNGDPLTFSVKDVPKQLSAQVDGSTLKVEPAGGTQVGTNLTFTVVVSDGTSEATAPATVTVVSSDAPLATVVDDVIPEADAGKTYVEHVLDNDVAPIDGKPLTIVSAVLESGSGQVSHDASTVTATPDASFVGTMVVAYTVDDGTGDPSRQVTGRLRLTVRAAPDAPGTPTVVEVRSHTAVIRWAPPKNNGAAITKYTVTVNGQGGGTRESTGTTLTVDNLTNDRPYTFTVTAWNAVGESLPSQASAQITPDAVPDPPAAPQLAFGDGSLTVSWKNADYAGERSAIESVTLEISPAPSSGVAQKTGVTGTTLVWDGLTNGTAYTVRVQALNKAGNSPWSPPSASEIPAGVPDPPGQPTTGPPTRFGTAQAQMVVTWTAPASNNGDAVSNYTLNVFHGGSTPVQSIPAGTALSQAVTVDTSETGYTYQVVATNKAGDSGPSVTSAPRRAVVPPDPPSAVTASATGVNNQVLISATALSADQRRGALASEVSYEYSASGAPWVRLEGSTGTATGLNNGQYYAIRVRAVTTVDGAQYVSGPTSATYTGYNTSAAGVAPFGPLPDVIPSISASVFPTYIVFGTETFINGCSATIHYSIDGGTWKVATTNPWTSGAIGDGPGQTHYVDAYQATDCGQTTATHRRSATTPQPPAVSGTVSKGASAQGQTGCSSSACAWLVLNYQNLPSGTYTLKCWSNDGGSWAIFPTGYSFTRTLSGSGSFQTPCYYGFTGKQVRIEVVGQLTTPNFTW